MFGYITIIILLQMVPLLISDLASQYFISHLTVLILAISAIINAPVLYFYSSEYRKAMQKDLPLVKKLAIWFSNFK
uniref:Candidate secreted effector n=1 Tax=Meloidogyne incognita TaxID=6306 RepID=A0A914N055_MELIC